MQILFNNSLGTYCTDSGMIAILNIMRNLLTLIQIVVPILLIITTSIELFKLVRNPDTKDGLKHIKNKLIAAIVVFFVPMFIDVLLNMLPNSMNLSSCWEVSKNRAELSGTTMTHYIDPTDTNVQKSSLYTNPDDYQKGEKKQQTTSNGSSNTSSSSSTQSQSQNQSQSETQSQTQTNETTGTISGSDIIAYARKFKGQAYERGGSWNGELPYTPTDCVGFVRGVYKHFGISIPSNTSSLYNNTKKFTVVTGQPVKAGDIVIYAHHRALITGNGNQVIHAMGEAYGIGQSKNYKSCGAGKVLAVVRVNKVY